MEIFKKLMSLFAIIVLNVGSVAIISYLTVYLLVIKSLVAALGAYHNGDATGLSENLFKAFIGYAIFYITLRAVNEAFHENNK